MKVDYLSCRIVPSGGTKIIAQHVRLLHERGHQARILTTDPQGDGLWGVEVVRVRAYDQGLFRDSQVVIGSWLRDVEEASRIKGLVLCHLCQGYEPLELSFRINEEGIPPKYRYRGNWGRLLLQRKKWSFRKRIRKIEKIYRLPTIKIAVSQALRDILEPLYGTPCYVVPNGVDTSLFKPPPGNPSPGGPLRILSVGAMDVALKGIDDVLEAVRILKQGGVPVEFTRVSLSPPTETEKKSGLVDRYLTGLSESEMAAVYQETHILISPSLGEGFGLPVLEAMSCGVPCILSDVGSYRSLDPSMDFAHFVPIRSPGAIAEGVLRIRDAPGCRETLVKRGFEVANRYTLEQMGNRLEETLLNILDKKILQGGKKTTAFTR
jgi:glycosyltransferase involved in cell wall biosynthesis